MKIWPNHDRTQAFTLVELLVIIAIIGTLVSLLLPAVQTASRTNHSQGRAPHPMPEQLAANRNGTFEFRVGAACPKAAVLRQVASLPSMRETTTSRTVFTSEQALFADGYVTFESESIELLVIAA